MSGGEQNKPCGEIAELLVFYVCNEVSEQERAAIEKHLGVCAACREQLSEERQFQQTIETAPQAGDQMDASGILLSRFRSELAEKLDDLQRPAVREKVPAFGWMRGWMAMHPAWSGATLVLLGLVAGTEYAQWSSARSDDASQGQVVNVRPNSQLTDDQLSKMNVAGINFSPSPYSGSKNVRVRLNSEQPMEVSGNVDDTNVQTVLTFVVRNDKRFDSGMRLDCLDALKARAADLKVRAALLDAARKDQNPAVRLKALEALRDAGVDSTVREALLDALQHDSNPGVRVEAVNLLVRSLEEAPAQSLVPPPPQEPEMPSGPMMQAGTIAVPNDGSIANVIRTLESLQQNDPSRYVRLRSAAALREISSRSDQ
jgi:HEAT repeats/Putative zinc-finger